MQAKIFALVLLLALINFIAALPQCPPGEYNPGRNCKGTEPSCPPRHISAHPKHTCDCWCKPGTYRVLDSSQACVTDSGCHLEKPANK